jgi:hypothetical protein
LLKRDAFLFQAEIFAQTLAAHIFIESFFIRRQARQIAMNTGKTLFAQLMDFLPWTTFVRYVARYGGDKGYAQSDLRRAVPRHGLRPTDLPREPARHRSLFVGTGREALPHGLSRADRRSTLADANESRDWRIYADFANV